MTDPRTPVDDMRAVPEALRDIRRRLSELEAPTGTQAFRSVAKLEVALAELEVLVNNIEATLTDFIENDVEALVDTKVAAAIAAALAGDVVIGGKLTVLDAFTRDLTAISGSRKSLWIHESGDLGVTG